MLLCVVNVLFICSFFNCLVAPQAEITEKQLTENVSKDGSDKEAEVDKDNERNDPASVEENEPSTHQNKDDNASSMAGVESTWNKNMDQFKSITFDLTEEAAAQFINTEVMKTLETVKGLEYTPEEMTRFKIWPQGIIPYFIDQFSYDKILSDKIRGYLEATNRLTGLQFTELPRPPTDSNERWIFFLNRVQRLDCYDPGKEWGSPGGIQRVIVGYECLDNGGHMASLVLTMVSVAPQHTSPDRDKYIQVLEENCLPDLVRAGQFATVRPQNWLFRDIEYDFLSAGHYSFYKYTNNGKATIRPREPVNIPVGETKGFSFTDVYKIRRLYNTIRFNGNKEHQLSNCQKLYRPKTGDVMNSKLFNSVTEAGTKSVPTAQFTVKDAGTKSVPTAQFTIKDAGTKSVPTAQFNVKDAGTKSIPTAQFNVKDAGTKSVPTAQFNVKHAGDKSVPTAQFTVKDSGTKSVLVIIPTKMKITRGKNLLKRQTTEDPLKWPDVYSDKK